jgi:hypothetical protein
VKTSRIRVALSLILFIALSSRCKGPESPAEHVAGTYTLVSINAHALPAPSGEGGIDTVRAATLTLRANESFSVLTSYFGADIADAGTFTVNGGLIAFTETTGSGRLYVGSFLDNDLTVHLGTDAWLYHRQ